MGRGRPRSPVSGIECVRDSETGRERRRHHSKVLGKKNKTRKFEAKEALNKIVSPLNAAQTSRRDDRVSLRWFGDNRLRSIVEGIWGPTTRKTKEHFIRVILEKFGDNPLRELDGVELQGWINQLASEYSRSMVFHCRKNLKSMCAEAVETFLEWPQYQFVIDAAQTLRDKLAIKVGSGTAVRPGELFAFRWRSLEKLRTAGTLSVSQRRCTKAASTVGQD